MQHMFLSACLLPNKMGRLYGGGFYVVRFYCVVNCCLPEKFAVACRGAALAPAPCRQTTIHMIIITHGYLLQSPDVPISFLHMFLENLQNFGR